jgi:hypothetical protein
MSDMDLIIAEAGKSSLSRRALEEKARIVKAMWAMTCFKDLRQRKALTNRGRIHLKLFYDFLGSLSFTHNVNLLLRFEVLKRGDLQNFPLPAVPLVPAFCLRRPRKSSRAGRSQSSNPFEEEEDSRFPVALFAGL